MVPLVFTGLFVTVNAEGIDTPTLVTVPSIDDIGIVLPSSRSIFVPVLLFFINEFAVIEFVVVAPLLVTDCKFCSPSLIIGLELSAASSFHQYSTTDVPT